MQLTNSFKPDEHEVWYSRGLAYNKLGDYQQEIASYDKALSFKPDYHPAWHNRGNALDELGDYR